MTLSPVANCYAKDRLRREQAGEPQPDPDPEHPIVPSFNVERPSGTRSVKPIPCYYSCIIPNCGRRLKNIDLMVGHLSTCHPEFLKTTEQMEHSKLFLTRICQNQNLQYNCQLQRLKSASMLKYINDERKERVRLKEEQKKMGKATPGSGGGYRHDSGPGSHGGMSGGSRNIAGQLSTEGMPGLHPNGGIKRTISSDLIALGPKAKKPRTAPVVAPQKFGGEFTEMNGWGGDLLLPS